MGILFVGILRKIRVDSQTVCALCWKVVLGGAYETRLRCSARDEIQVDQQAFVRPNQGKKEGSHEKQGYVGA